MGRERLIFKGFCNGSQHGIQVTVTFLLMGVMGAGGGGSPKRSNTVLVILRMTFEIGCSFNGYNGQCDVSIRRVDDLC